MEFDITWIVQAFDEIQDPDIQDRITALGLLAAEVEARTEQ